jgi:hypothetical protein
VNRNDTSLRGKNLDWLQSLSPALHLSVSSAPSIPFEIGKTGYPTFKSSGRYAHSPYDPVREAERQFASSGYAGQSVVVCFGVGAGYGLLPLIGLDSCERIVLVEENPSWFSLSCDVVDYVRLAKGRRLAFCLGPDAPDFTALLSGTDASSVFVLEHGVLASDPASRFYAEARDSFRMFLKHLSADANTSGYFSLPWFMNSWLNAARRRESLDLTALKSAFNRRPAAVVSAGPGLEESFGLLRTMAGQGAVLIAAASVVRRLAEGGLVPHFVVSTDAGFYNSWNTREGLPDKRTLLVADISAHHGGLPDGEARFAFFDFGLGFARPIKRHMPGFTMAGTVASSCMELAAFLGCGPVTLFGQDFGFPSMISHCRGTIHERWGRLVQSRTRTLDTLDADGLMSEDRSWTEDYDSRPIMTSVKHLLYRDWFAKTWPGVMTAGRSSVRTEGIVPVGSSPEGKYSDPFLVMDQKLRPLIEREPGNEIRDRVARLANALERENSADGILSSAGPEIEGELRSALGREVRSANGKATEGLRTAVRRCCRVMAAAVSRLA